MNTTKIISENVAARSGSGLITARSTTWSRGEIVMQSSIRNEAPTMWWLKLYGVFSPNPSSCTTDRFEIVVSSANNSDDHTSVSLSSSYETQYTEAIGASMENDRR